MFHQEIRQLQLNTRKKQSVSYAYSSTLKRNQTRQSHVDRILVRLGNRSEHLSGLDTLFINEASTNIQQLRESDLNNVVELGAQFPCFKSIHAADGQETLQSSENRIRIVGVHQLEGEVHIIRPLLREVILQDLG